MVKYSSALLNETFGALADPTRRRMMEMLAEQECRVTELAAPFAMSLPAVSKHLRVLENAGLLKRRRLGREHRLELDPAPIREAMRWIEQYRKFWRTRSTTWPPISKPLTNPNPKKTKEEKMNATTTPDQTLHVTRLIKAPRARVFAAWTTPEIMKWLGGDGCQVVDAAIDLRPGGEYRFQVKGKHGDTEIYGTYREVKAPSRLVFTWQGTCGACPTDTLVTVDLTEKNGGTEVSITHEGFADAENRDGHNDGWTVSLRRLETALLG
jgi:uncharacterized protein YndB with AHSA1/START domain/DNA-binding transcriptional ArsR family regulator